MAVRIIFRIAVVLAPLLPGFWPAERQQSCGGARVARTQRPWKGATTTFSGTGMANARSLYNRSAEHVGAEQNGLTKLQQDSEVQSPSGDIESPLEPAYLLTSSPAELHEALNEYQSRCSGPCPPARLPAPVKAGSFALRSSGRAGTRRAVAMLHGRGYWPTDLARNPYGMALGSGFGRSNVFPTRTILVLVQLMHVAPYPRLGGCCVKSPKFGG
ncbi:hypothetical protein FOMPIDRAFT_117047 [Fomitopsis schrenkii]|uniref:Uncharacterized protein n=1 Tax=Fomitopsis schrenkii TaxID=2126942 RepID=S8FEU6_FOMSC|nr:hypothetical protein FOMPIDRAFT_117047 [Fomitopsis schrenkii]